MSKINALIEAGKKATAGPWVVRGGDGCKEVRGNKAGRAKQDQYKTEVCATPGLSDEAEDRANAEFIAAARNAVDEVEELRDWVRDTMGHRSGCNVYFDRMTNCFDESRGCTCGLDRIREILGG